MSLLLWYNRSLCVDKDQTRRSRLQEVTQRRRFVAYTGNERIGLCMINDWIISLGGFLLFFVYIRNELKWKESTKPLFSCLPWAKLVQISSGLEDEQKFVRGSGMDAKLGSARCSAGEMWWVIMEFGIKHQTELYWIAPSRWQESNASIPPHRLCSCRECGWKGVKGDTDTIGLKADLSIA